MIIHTLSFLYDPHLAPWTPVRWNLFHFLPRAFKTRPNFPTSQSIKLSGNPVLFANKELCYVRYITNNEDGRWNRGFCLMIHLINLSLHFPILDELKYSTSFCGVSVMIFKAFLGQRISTHAKYRSIIVDPLISFSFI